MTALTSKLNITTLLPTSGMAELWFGCFEYYHAYRSGNTFNTPTTSNQYPYQASTSYTLRFPRYRSDNIFKLKVTTARSNDKSRSHHDVAHLHPLTNVPYQVPTPYGFRDIARTKFYRSRSLDSLWQSQRSSQGHTMTLHTYTP